MSISYVAVKMAEQIFGNLSGRSVLILGSGQMAELAALHLKAHGAGEIIVANRTLEKAIELANKIDGSAVSLNEISPFIPRVDVIISSLSQVDKPLITVSNLTEARRTKDLFLLDLGVPRNFTSDLSDLDNVYLYNIDDLSDISNRHKQVREDAAKEAEVLIDFGLMQFEKWLTRVVSQPEIIDMRTKVKEICKHELALLPGLTENSGHNSIDELSDRISNKISHYLLFEQDLK